MMGFFLQIIIEERAKNQTVIEDLLPTHSNSTLDDDDEDTSAVGVESIGDSESVVDPR